MFDFIPPAVRPLVLVYAVYLIGLTLGARMERNGHACPTRRHVVFTEPAPDITRSRRAPRRAAPRPEA